MASSENDSKSQSAFDRFMRSLLAVPAREIAREREEYEREKGEKADRREARSR